MKRQIVMAAAIMFTMCVVGTVFAEVAAAQQPVVSTKMSVDQTHNQIRGRVGVGRPGVGVGRPGSGIGFRPGVGAGAPGIGLTRPGFGIHPYRPGPFVYRPYRPWNRIIYPHPIPILGGPLIYIPIVYSIAQPIPVYTPAPDITPTALTFTFYQCQCTQLTVPYNAHFDVGGRLTTPDGTPIPSAVVSVQAFYNGQWYDTQRDITTDSNGYFTDNLLWTDMWQFPYGHTGDYHFRVVFYGDGSYAPSASNDIVTTITFPTGSQDMPSASNEAVITVGGQHTVFTR